jgi:energy-coupling factor transport system ATP-binding protein
LTGPDPARTDRAGPDRDRTDRARPDHAHAGGTHAGGIRLNGFGWRHAGRKAWAVRGVDLRVERGERVLLLGPSGAGKSTLLAALAGLLAEDSGEREGELDLGGLRPGIVFQDPQTQLVMSRAGDDVAFGLENHGVPTGEIWPRVDDALATVGFRYGRDRSTAALSGGEAQRLALAGAFALRPSLLLLDEPTANLDPAGAAQIRAAIGRILAARDTTLILVEHRVAEVLPLVDRVVVLEPGGGVAADGAPGAVFATHGGRLVEQGVWVPGHPVTRERGPMLPSATNRLRPHSGMASAADPLRPANPGGPLLLRADGVSVTGRLSTMDLLVPAGQALAVVGPNGAGKSTLALLLGGLLAPGSGTVTATRELAGTLAGRPPHRWRAAALARRIGSVFQNPEHQFVTARVRDELALGPRRTGAGEDAVKSIVDDLLVRLHLDRLAAANPYTLSGGEARRLSVATALATAPRLLILDEPTFGQDRRTWVELVDLLAKLRDDGRAVVAVTHDADFAAALADRTVALPAPGAPSGADPAGAPSGAEPASPAIGADLASPSIGADLAGVPTGADLAGVPSGADPASPPIGADPASPPNGADPASPPIGADPAGTPSGADPAGAPSGGSAARSDARRAHGRRGVSR